MVLCLRETPLSTIALENSLKLSREGVVIMPVCPPFYKDPKSMADLIDGYCDKVLMAIGAAETKGWRSEQLE
jgi:4-hydroxy-3-polyprenylbenzoate decarboxylase